MAVDNKVPEGTPGVASFASETWGNRPNYQFGDTPAIKTRTIPVTASGADVEIVFLDVLNGSGALADWNATRDAGSADFIAATTITIADGDTKDVPVYDMGHFDMDALRWDSSYDTDAKKKDAFLGSDAPGLFVSKGKHDSDDIY